MRIQVAGEALVQRRPEESAIWSATIWYPAMDLAVDSACNVSPGHDSFVTILTHRHTFVAGLIDPWQKS